MDQFSIPTHPQLFSIGTDNPSPFELLVFEEVVQTLNEQPEDPSSAASVSRVVQKEYPIAVPANGTAEDKKAAIAHIVWRVFINIAKQMDVRDEKQSKLAIILSELNKLHSKEFPCQALEKNPLRLQDMFTTETSVANAKDLGTHDFAQSKRRTLGVCAFLAHLSFKGLILDHTSALAVPCMDLIRDPPRANIEQLLSLPYKEQKPRVEELSAADQSEIENWIARVHVSALWIHFRGRQWLDQGSALDRAEVFRGIEAWLPLPLKVHSRDNRGELWAAWVRAYEELAKKSKHPDLIGVAQDAVTRMKMVAEAERVHV